MILNKVVTMRCDDILKIALVLMSQLMSQLIDLRPHNQLPTNHSGVYRVSQVESIDAFSCVNGPLASMRQSN